MRLLMLPRHKSGWASRHAGSVVRGRLATSRHGLDPAAARSLWPLLLRAGSGGCQCRAPRRSHRPVCLGVHTCVTWQTPLQNLLESRNCSVHSCQALPPSISWGSGGLRGSSIASRCPAAPAGFGAAERSGGAVQGALPARHVSRRALSLHAQPPLKDCGGHPSRPVSPGSRPLRRKAPRVSVGGEPTFDRTARGGASSPVTLQSSGVHAGRTVLGRADDTLRTWEGPCTMSVQDSSGLCVGPRVGRAGPGAKPVVRVFPC